MVVLFNDMGDNGGGVGVLFCFVCFKGTREMLCVPALPYHIGAHWVTSNDQQLHLFA